MSLLTLKEIHVSFGPQTVLDNVGLVVHPGDRIGIVGPNGAGKSTLFGVILGRVVPSIGQVFTTRGLRVGHLPQEVHATEHVTLGEHLRSAFASHDQLAAAIHDVSEQLSTSDADEQEALLNRLARLQSELDAVGGYHYESKIGEVCAGLSIDDLPLDRPMTSLSGGQLSRAALARLLLTSPDLLLLDEPTNHLDLAATEWLENFLLSFSGAMMVISHDRYLLDKVAQKIVEVGGRGLRLYSTTFRDYVATRAVQRVQQQREFEKQQAFIAKERDFIARFRAGQRAKEARGRETRLERMIRDGELSARQVHDDKPFRFEFNVEQPGGQMIVRCTDATKAYGERVLFTRLNLEVTRGQKVGIIGPNGVGKTTLLKMLLGQVEPDDGKVRLMENLDVGYLDQHLAVLDEKMTVLAAVVKARPAMSETHARSLLAWFGFPGDAVAKEIGNLSGGEQTRLAMCTMVLSNHQVLLLDEPTNHLDMAAREALEEALLAYPGTIIVVSHDRYFLDRVTDHLLVMAHGGAHEYVLGNYTYYQRLLAERAHAAEAEAAENRVKARKAAKIDRQRAGSAPAPAKGADWPEEIRHLARLSVAKLEEKIIDLEGQLETVHAQFSDTSLYSDPGKLAEATRLVAQIQKDLELYNAAWERKAQ
ncbi:MAG: ABC-F family ATP-binding cassette domain-containing protein [Phycisphaerae bacterium]|nr:ABC-F family ATP-binding cassette domain-containing protein [Phycisphaerae bacterium]